ncbi:MAG: amidase [Bacilli bacterium]|nr:amidase [Bacilli bacterium]
MEYETLSALELGHLVQSGQADPETVLAYFIDRIERLNPLIHAFTYTKFAEATAAAKALKERIASGERVGPLSGVPFALKDFLPSKKGWPASHGGVLHYQSIDPLDSEVCKALESMDAICVGKTNAPSFGFSGLTDNKMYGPTHNPFDLSKNSGGSSGGSAAAVASGMVLIAEGGDAGGSIRIPAAWNNLFGFKASAGLIPSVIRPDSFSATHPYCCTGVLTKTVEDSAFLLNALVRYDRRDPTSIPFAHEDFTLEMKQSLRGKRFAYVSGLGILPVDPEIEAKVRTCLKKLIEAGAIVEEVKMSFPRSAKEIMEQWCLSLSFDSYIEFETLKQERGIDFLKEHGDEVHPLFAEYVEKAGHLTTEDLYQFNLTRTEILDAFEDVFTSYDAILSPTACCFPPENALEKGTTQGPSEINGISIDSNLGFAPTFLANFVGYPAASVPAGIGENGLPVGLHVLAPKYQDALVLAIGKTIENLAPWRGFYQTAYRK